MSVMMNHEARESGKQNPKSKDKLHTDIQKILIQERMRNHNRAYQHPSYILEKRLTQAISEGEAPEALDLLERINGLERAELSEDPIRSLKNSLIGSCTIFARAAIQGGVDAESAFMLSDLFIRQIERVFAKPQAESLEYDMLLAFVSSVNDSRQAAEASSYSPTVVRTRVFVRENIHRQLTLSMVADSINIHPNYLSTIFTKECRQTFSSFVDEERIKQIKKFLAYTDMPLSNLATNFEFSSFSHFSTYFKKNTGLSPRDYRKKSREGYMLGEMEN